jgi:hypothetical protein
MSQPTNHQKHLSQVSQCPNQPTGKKFVSQARCRFAAEKKMENLSFCALPFFSGYFPEELSQKEKPTPAKNHPHSTLQKQNCSKLPKR